MKELHQLTAAMMLRGPASPAAIQQAEARLGVCLPPDYTEFLRTHNGGEGPIGDKGYGVLFAVEELPKTQENYSELDHFAGWVIFGSDGGGEGWVFAEDGFVLVVPWLGNKEDALPQGTFTEVLRRVGAGTTFDAPSAGAAT